MPLKHTTETLLIFVLAVAIIVTGMLMQTLADLPSGLVPWAILFVLAVAYPLSLSHLFRRNRADYEFRLLHWFPAAMLLLWIILQAAFSLHAGFVKVFDWLTWGWSLPMVVFGFVLMAGFIMSVIRRWTTRVALLLVAFIPFLVGSVANEYYDWTPQMAATLWHGEWWQIDMTGKYGSGTQVAMTDEEDKNLNPSEDPAEEWYRDRLRAIETRKDRIVARMEERLLGDDEDEQMDDDEEMVMAGSHSSTRSYPPPRIGSSSSMPAQLPGSGFGWMAILILLLAGYCAALQKRTMMRIDNA